MSNNKSNKRAEAIGHIIFLVVVFITSYATLYIMHVAGLNVNINWLIFSLIYSFIWYVLYTIADKVVT
jgi:hypothetical protein